MNELIQPVLALGGLGYLNFLIYSRIDNPDFGSESDKKLMILLYSSMNYGIYLLLSLYFKLVPSILIAISLSIILTLFFPFISRKLFLLTNWIRSIYGAPDISNTKVQDKFFEKKESFPMFIFSIPDNTLITCGYRGSKNGMNEDFSIINYNFYGNEEFCRIKNEKDLLDYIENKNIEADIYVNFDKKIKIISFPLLVEAEQMNERGEGL